MKKGSHANPLHVGRPNVGDRAVFDRLVDEIFERRWFTNNGQVVQEFERRLTENLGVKHCIPVCNATIGLQLACRAMELTGEVILPSFTFVASAHALSMSGLKPVFADVNRDTHCICPDSATSLINERTSAIMGVHLWGRPCNVARLKSIADKHNLKLIYDAAHAFHCEHQETRIGNFGNCEVFSFHATKFFNSFEGGAIATNDDHLAAKVRQMKNFGFDGPEQIACVGTNAKMSEIHAAMGISLFSSVDQIAEANRENFLVYQALLGGVQGLKLFDPGVAGDSNYQYVVLEIDEASFCGSRDDVFEALNRNRIFAKRYFKPGCHKMEPYRTDFVASGRQLPNTELLCERVLCLPTGPSVQLDDLKMICEIVLQSRRCGKNARSNSDSRKTVG